MSQPSSSNIIRKREQYHHLRRLFRCLKFLQYIYLTDDDFHQFGIELSPLNLNGGSHATLEGETQYFAPLAKEKLQALSQPKFELSPYEPGHGIATSAARRNH